MTKADGPSKFCVLTTGRSGSTSLMDALEKFDDIALPSRDIDCPFNELLHSHFLAQYAKQYSELCNREITLASQLVECFFQHNADARFAGFKSMPKRKQEYTGFINDPDFQLITLIRRDVASTIASFMHAGSENAWRRRGEEPPSRWTFRQGDTKLALKVLNYLHNSMTQLNNLPGAIHLVYEDLCHPDYCNGELDTYFGRAIRLENPKPPTSGRDYVTNWDQFEPFVMDSHRQLQEKSSITAPS